MSRFYKMYNSTDRCWEHIIYTITKHPAITTESYKPNQSTYKTPIGLINIYNFTPSSKNGEGRRT